jgi:tRNA pseudouridine55 synthase
MKKQTERSLNGLLLVDKPTGVTSHDVVAQARKILQTREVGHSGTLDPMASGLMVLLIGEATKLSSYVTDGDKTYLVKLKLGIETDTLDSTGEILKTTPVTAGFSEVVKAAMDLQGEVKLPIPMYSAKKIDGKKMYEYAREEVAIVQPEKIMKFWSVELIKNEMADDQKNHIYQFKISCSKGSFIRAWVDRVGKTLNCGAVMTGLRRTRSHQFLVDHAQSLESLATNGAKDGGVPLIPLTEAINEVKKLKVKDMDLNLLKNGQISQNLRTHLIRVFDPEKDQFIRVHSDRPEVLVALIGLDATRGFVIRRVFNGA